MALRFPVRLLYLPRYCRHLSTKADSKDKKKLKDIYQFNKQSLIVYGPLTNSKPRKRNYKPVYYKEPQETVQLHELEEECLLPILNIACSDHHKTLDLNELLACPLIAGEGVDPRIYKIEGEKPIVKIDMMKFLSVTTILDKTMSEKNRKFLEKWKREQIELLGEDGFLEMQKETLETGRNFHSCLHLYLSGQSEADLVMTSQLRDGLWSSVRHVLDHVSGVQFLEERIAHPQLLYSGIVDCVAEYKGAICVIDWKTSKKQKRSLAQTYDNPVQLAAYAGALNMTQPAKIRQGTLVYAYHDGSPADVISVSASKMHHYWLQWLQRLQTYWKMHLTEN